MNQPSVGGVTVSVLDDGDRSAPKVTMKMIGWLQRR